MPTAKAPTYLYLPVQLTALVGVVLLSGCQICCEAPDEYPAYGGAWERTDRLSGRVGSLLKPAGMKASVISDRDEPRTPEEIDRSRVGNTDENALEPDKIDGGDTGDSSSQQDDETLRDRIERLKKEQLEDINLQPRKPAPPSLY